MSQSLARAESGDIMTGQNTLPVEENAVRGGELRKQLGLPGGPIGVSRCSAIKHAMGLKHVKYVSVSRVRDWLNHHPKFSEKDVYHRSGCRCKKCLTGDYVCRCNWCLKFNSMNEVVA
jgi:hypothetical protein